MSRAKALDENAFKAAKFHSWLNWDWISIHAWLKTHSCLAENPFMPGAFARFRLFSMRMQRFCRIWGG
jgi:hypothetical protein